MRVAGFGLRANAQLSSFAQALAAVGGAQALATAADKADHPALTAFAQGAGLRLAAVAPAAIAFAHVALSPHSPARYGGRSVAEASALIAAGAGARIVVPVQKSPDGRVTVAVAEGNG